MYWVSHFKHSTPTFMMLDRIKCFLEIYNKIWSYIIITENRSFLLLVILKVGLFYRWRCLHHHITKVTVLPLPYNEYKPYFICFSPSFVAQHFPQSPSTLLQNQPNQVYSLPMAHISSMNRVHAKIYLYVNLLIPCNYPHHKTNLFAN